MVPFVIVYCKIFDLFSFLIISHQPPSHPFKLAHVGCRRLYRPRQHGGGDAQPVVQFLPSGTAVLLSDCGKQAAMDFRLDYDNFAGVFFAQFLIEIQRSFPEVSRQVHFSANSAIVK